MAGNGSKRPRRKPTYPPPEGPFVFVPEGVTLPNEKFARYRKWIFFGVIGVVGMAYYIDMVSQYVRQPEKFQSTVVWGPDGEWMIGDKNLGPFAGMKRSEYLKTLEEKKQEKSS